jgi:hypothetical protein
MSKDKLKEKLNLNFGNGDMFYTMSCGKIERDMVLDYTIGIKKDGSFAQYLKGDKFHRNADECALDPDLLMHQILTNYKKSILEDLE